MSVKGCILIHGFSGSPKEIELLASHLEARGFDISTPILAGHDSGSSLNRKEMAAMNWLDWLESAEAAVKEMVDRHGEVYLVGFSMGGLIAGYLSTKYPVKRLVLLSASVIYTNPKRFIRDILKKPMTKTQIKRYYAKFKTTPLKATLNFRRLVKNLTPYIEYIESPTLIIQGEQDDLVDPSSAKYIYDTIKSEEKYIHLLPKSKHVVCWDCEKEKVVELVSNFLL